MKSVFILLLITLISSCATGPSKKDIEGYNRVRHKDTTELIESFRTEVWEKPLKELFRYYNKIANGSTVIDLPRPSHIHGYPRSHGVTFSKQCNPDFPRPKFKFQLYYKHLKNGKILVSGYLGYELKVLKGAGKDAKCVPWNVRGDSDEDGLPVARLRLFNNWEDYYTIFVQGINHGYSGYYFNDLLSEKILPKVNFKNAFGTVAATGNSSYFYGPLYASDRGNVNYSTINKRLTSFTLYKIEIDPKTELSYSLSEIIHARMKVDHFIDIAKSARTGRKRSHQRSQDIRNAKLAKEQASRRAYKRKMEKKFGKDTAPSFSSFQNSSDSQFEANLQNTYKATLNSLRNARTKKARSQSYNYQSSNSRKKVDTRPNSPGHANNVRKCSIQDKSCKPRAYSLCRHKDTKNYSCHPLDTHYSGSMWKAKLSSRHESCRQYSKNQNAVAWGSFSLNTGFISGKEYQSNDPKGGCIQKCLEIAQKEKVACLSSK